MNQVHEQAEYILNSACDWQPMELLQGGYHVVFQTEVEDHVLDSL